MNPVYESLNALARTAWILNKNVYDVIRTAWENGGDIADLPSRQDKPVPPHNPEYSQREWFRLLKKISQHNMNLHSLRCDTMLKLSVAKDFQNEKMYFPHNLDFRGRSYPVPPHLNHLGADINRSMLMFYEVTNLQW
jgi:DNA-directed RNA polymerase